MAFTDFLILAGALAGGFVSGLTGCRYGRFATTGFNQAVLVVPVVSGIASIAGA